MDRALAEMTPPGWAHCVAPIDDHVAELLPEERHLVRHAVESRRREFAAGRWCARQALGTLGAVPGPILRRPDGAPVWPVGFVASLSHSAGLCVAVAAHARSARAVGVDFEWTAGVDASLLPTIAGADEISANRRETGLSGLAACLFCAKEAVFKAYNPATGAFLEFGDVTVRLDLVRRAFRAELSNPRLPGLFGKRRIYGKITFVGGYVLALASIS
jgi:4'-phosphopantetheinyl transferase EntD